MTFEILWTAVKRGELILIDGGMCHWHRRKDGQLTIHEIISIRPGAGTEMLERLKKVRGVTKIVAKCSADMEANKWYLKKGFILAAQEKAKSGRILNVWEMKKAGTPSSPSLSPSIFD